MVNPALATAAANSSGSHTVYHRRPFGSSSQPVRPVALRHVYPAPGPQQSGELPQHVRRVHHVEVDERRGGPDPIKRSGRVPRPDLAQVTLRGRRVGVGGIKLILPRPRDTGDGAVSIVTLKRKGQYLLPPMQYGALKAVG